MKSFAKLLKNEFIKIFHQTSYRVLIIILAALFIIVPLGLKGINALFNLDFFVADIDEEIQYYEDWSAEASTEAGRIYNKTFADCLRLFKDCGLDSSSWQYSSMFYPYVESTMREIMYDMLDKKTVDLESIMQSEFQMYYEEEATEENYKELSLKNKSEKERYIDLIKNANVSEYYKSARDTLVSYRDNYKSYVEMLTAQNLISKDEKIANDIEFFSSVVDGYGSLIGIYDTLIKENAEFNGWKYNSAVAAKNTLASIEGSGRLFTKDEFMVDTSLCTFYDSYDEYKDEWENIKQDKCDALRALLYSVENNIPTQSTQKSSSKNLYRNTIISNLDFIMYFAIVLAALIVANEFTSGTSRLLFVRPHRREKIICSKYVTVLSIIVALNVINVIVTFIMTMITNGVGDLFAPDLAIKGGEVVEKNAFFVFIGMLILANFRILFITTLTFMIASMTRKGALAIVLGIVADMVVSLVSSVVVMFDSAVVKFLPFSYYSLEALAANKLEATISQNYTASIMGALTTVQSGLTADLSIIGGVANYVFWIGVCFASTILVFKKREITN